MLILVFAFIPKATPVERPHFKYLLAQSICKNVGVEFIK